jgi:hypothetical protein
MSGFIVRGQEIPGPSGVEIQNFRMGGVVSLRNQARTVKDVTEVVIHETVTQSWQATVAVLQERGLGVHMIVSYDGTVYQHADLASDETWHASEHNPMSVGIETVNPFEKQYLPKLNPPWSNTLDVPWVGDNPYIVATPAQSESVCQVIDWLSSPASTLSIPKNWIGLQGGKSMFMNRMKISEQGPGIYAHRYFADHQDGPWLVLYAWLRLVAQLDPATAYAEALRRAVGVDNVDLSDYFVAQTPGA